MILAVARVGTTALAQNPFKNRKKVYIEVLGGNVLRALGTRYSKNKPEGEHYSW